MAFKRRETGSKKVYCSFCGKNDSEVVKMIAGPSVYICNECIGLCSDILEEEVKPEELQEAQPDEMKEEKLPIMAPFKREGTVYFSSEIKDDNEVNIILNRVACLAFSNIFTQLAITDFDNVFSFDTKELDYGHKGRNFKITVCE